MLVVVGQIARPHGIRGEVIVDVRTDDPEQRYAAGSVLTTEPASVGPLTIGYAKPHAAAGTGRLIVAFEGITDRNMAETLRGTLLWVESADLPASEDPDEFSDHELMGLAAVTPEGERLGEVTRIEHAPASDLLVLRKPDGGTALIPFVKAIVPEVDLAGGRVVVTPPPGLLEL
jgi:16S rRNA processing protein RimM